MLMTLRAFKNPCRPGWRIFSQPAFRKGLKGIDNISSEDEEPQQKEGKEGRKKGEDSESGNLSDCDQAIRVHKHIAEEKVTRKQQKAMVKNVEIEKDNLDNCNRGNINKSMNNGAEDIPCVTNENPLQSRLSTRSKKVPISRNRHFCMGNMK
jgi:hypothetical protein